MNALPPELDAIIEECLQDVTAGRMSLEDCLARYADLRPQLEPRLRVALLLRQASQPVGPPARARKQTWRAYAAPRRVATPRGWRVAALAGLILILLALPSGIASADSAAPGDLLFPADRAIEQTQLQLSSPEQAVSLRLDFADERLAEAEGLLARQDIPHAEEALDLYDQLLDQVAAAIEIGQVTPDTAEYDRVDQALSRHETRLLELLDQVPEPGQKGIQRAIEASQKQRNRIKDAKEKGHGKPEDTPGGGPPEDKGKPQDKGQPVDQGQSDGKGGGPPDEKGNSGNSQSNGKGNSAGQGKQDKLACPDGSKLKNKDQARLEELAATYDVEFDEVLALHCDGLSIEEIEAQLQGGTP